jgi:virginiamycin B lyase
VSEPAPASTRGHAPHTPPRRRADGLFAALILTLAVATVVLLARAGDGRGTPAPARPTTSAALPATPPGVKTMPARLRAYPMPNAGADLMQPAIGPDGRVWFGEMGTNQLAALDPSTGAVATWAPPHGQYGIMDVAVAPDGAVWFTEQSSNYIGRFDPRHATFTTFPLASSRGHPAAPQDIAIDGNGTIWFTEVSAGMIGRLDPATGKVKTYPVPTEGAAAAYPFGVALDGRGAVWFSELTGGIVGRLDAATGTVRLFRAPTRDAQVFALALDPAGRVWFTELQYGRLGVLDPASGAMREISLPAPGGSALNLYGVVAAQDGTIWAAAMGQNAIARYDPVRNALTMLALPDANSVPYGIFLDAAGNVWFTADRDPINYVARIER